MVGAAETCWAAKAKRAVAAAAVKDFMMNLGMERECVYWLC